MAQIFHFWSFFTQKFIFYKNKLVNYLNLSKSKNSAPKKYDWTYVKICSPRIIIYLSMTSVNLKLNILKHLTESSRTQDTHEAQKPTSSFSLGHEPRNISCLRKKASRLKGAIFANVIDVIVLISRRIWVHFVCVIQINNSVSFHSNENEGIFRVQLRKADKKTDQ